jgi:hypothetical protein
MNIKHIIDDETDASLCSTEPSTRPFDTQVTVPAPANRRYRHQFDFEIGYFVKSPCKTCRTRPIFPKCLDQCEVLDNIHSLLSVGVSCSRRR